MTEVEKLQADPQFAIELVLGPPCPELVPQDASRGLKFAGAPFCHMNVQGLF